MGFFRFLGHKHTYTSADVPWRTDTDGGTALFRYLRGGGIRCLGSSSAQDIRNRRQNRFLVCFALAACVWFLLWIA